VCIRLSALFDLEIFFEGVKTYSNVRIDEAHDVKGTSQKRLSLIENYQQNACYHPINSFEPLAVRLIRIAWMIAVVNGSLSG
jgi:hypothetical protein